MTTPDRSCDDVRQHSADAVATADSGECACRSPIGRASVAGGLVHGGQAHATSTGAEGMIGDAPSATRMLAAYGGVFVAGSLLWGVLADGSRPDRYDLVGAAICLVGVGLIMYAPRAA